MDTLDSHATMTMVSLPIYIRIAKRVHTYTCTYIAFMLHLCIHGLYAVEMYLATKNYKYKEEY